MLGLMRDPGPDPKPTWRILILPTLAVVLSPFLVNPPVRFDLLGALVALITFSWTLLLSLVVWHAARFARSLFRGPPRA